MAVVVTCPTCGASYESGSGAVRSGTWRRRCPACHPPRPPTLPDEKRARAMKPRQWWALDRALRRSGERRSAP